MLVERDDFFETIMQPLSIADASFRIEVKDYNNRVHAFRGLRCSKTETN